MRQAALAVALILSAIACAPMSVATTPPTGVASGPVVAESHGPSASISCADAPPPAVVESIEGIAVRAIDRDHVEITNDSDATLYYQIAGWQTAQLEGCVAVLEQVVEYGPLAPRTSITTTLGALAARLDVPVTVGIWDQPCGEGCDRPPLARISLQRSPVEPASSLTKERHRFRRG